MLLLSYGVPVCAHTRHVLPFLRKRFPLASFTLPPAPLPKSKGVGGFGTHTPLVREDARFGKGTLPLTGLCPCTSEALVSTSSSIHIALQRFHAAVFMQFSGTPQVTT